jgi:hypothetical protein
MDRLGIAVTLKFGDEIALECGQVAAKAKAHFPFIDEADLLTEVGADALEIVLAGDYGGKVVELDAGCGGGRRDYPVDAYDDSYGTYREHSTTPCAHRGSCGAGWE